MEVIYKFSEEYIEQLHQLYQTAWWSKGRSSEATRRCIKGSQVCIGLINPENRLVGFTRVLTDYTFKALIFDVIVCESQQDKGLGSTLISRVKEHKHLKKVKHFELYCLPELESFYVRHGFTSELGDIQLMRFSIE